VLRAQIRWEGKGGQEPSLAYGIGAPITPGTAGAMAAIVANANRQIEKVDLPLSISGLHSGDYRASFWPTGRSNTLCPRHGFGTGEPRPKQAVQDDEARLSGTDRDTTHYSAADITNLISCADKVCDLASRESPALSIVRSGAAPQVPKISRGKGGTRTLDPGIMSPALGSR